MTVQDLSSSLYTSGVAVCSMAVHRGSAVGLARAGTQHLGAWRRCPERRPWQGWHVRMANPSEGDLYVAHGGPGFAVAREPQQGRLGQQLHFTVW